MVKEKKKMEHFFNKLSLSRLTRTPYSEVFYVEHEEFRAIGRLDLHFRGDWVDATLIIWQDKIDEQMLNGLVDYVRFKLFHFTERDVNIEVYRGTRTRDVTLLPEEREPKIATEEDVQKIRDEIRRYIGRIEKMLGDHAMYVTKEHFEKRGFSVNKASAEIDEKFKVDLIAEKEKEIHLVQVKKGSVSSREIFKIFEKGRKLLKGRFDEHKSKFVDIVANRFPENWLDIRDSLLRKETEVKLNYIHLSSIA